MARTVISTQSIEPDASGITPASGNLGERAVSVFGSFAGSAFTSTAWGNVNSLALSAGDWIVCATFLTTIGGTISNMQHALSAYSDITTTDHVTGDNEAPALGSLLAVPFPIWYRFASGSSFTVYAKSKITYALAADVVKAKLEAYRWR